MHLKISSAKWRPFGPGVGQVKPASILTIFDSNIPTVFLINRMDILIAIPDYVLIPIYGVVNRQTVF